MTDWFEPLTGFRETDYADTWAKLAVEGDRPKSLVNGKSYGIGKLELVSSVARPCSPVAPSRLHGGERPVRPQC
jgi:hypothetical protein